MNLKHSRNYKGLMAIFALVMFLGISFKSNAQDGAELFKQNCASCHDPLKKKTGPALQGAKQRWADNADKTDIYTWVNDWGAAVATGDSYAKSIAVTGGMSKFPLLKKDDIDAIFAYVDAYTGRDGDGPADMASASGSEEEESGLSLWWYVVGGILLVVVIAAAGLKRQLAYANDLKEGKEEDKDYSYDTGLKAWAGRNMAVVAVFSIVALFSLLVVSFGWMKGVGVYEGYHPSQPIQSFSHEIHNGINGIDCQYCHSSASTSKHAGIPSVNVCMNCHKEIDGSSDQGKKDVEKIRAHAGWDSEAYAYNDTTQSPIVWNRVWVLPDHVFFSHAQHVNENVGNLDCKNCHGNVPTFGTMKVSPTSETAKWAQENGGVVLSKPAMTMGWCIECHNEKGIDLANGAYYEEIHRRLKKRPDILKRYTADDEAKITVKELGGWECAKCHY